VLDADAAGRKAALRSAELLIAEGMAVSLAALPQGEDPDSLILKQGPDRLRRGAGRRADADGILLGLFRESGDLRTQEGLMRATRAALELASHAQGAVQTEQMLREAAAGLNVGLDALQRDLRLKKLKLRLGKACPILDLHLQKASPKETARPSGLSATRAWGICGGVPA
jgi:DNA primase